MNFAQTKTVTNSWGRYKTNTQNGIVSIRSQIHQNHQIHRPRRPTPYLRSKALPTFHPPTQLPILTPCCFSYSASEVGNTTVAADIRRLVAVGTHTSLSLVAAVHDCIRTLVVESVLARTRCMSGPARMSGMTYTEGTRYIQPPAAAAGMQ